ncbi:substrate-binding periplasmic protein [Bdellovibrio sp. HCB209]|uniref:substrate-binding periplasmic protein n=1 Tax=Bdellovibrio sp. HCB209 TaxID=3394354 RepID=UPI0039B37111
MSIYVLILVLLTSLSAHSRIVIYTVESPPNVIKTSEGLDGLSGEYGKQIAASIKKAGKQNEFEIVWVPWKRALVEVEKNPRGLFFPFTRTFDREYRFNWVMHMAEVDCWLYAVDPKIKIEDYNQIAQYRVGVLAGSARELELRKHAGKNARVEGTIEDIANYRKLQAGRIDVWATHPSVMAEAQRLLKTNGGKPREIHALKKLFSQSLWLVANKEMSDKDRNTVESVFGWGTKRLMKPPTMTSGDFLDGTFL